MSLRNRILHEKLGLSIEEFRDIMVAILVLSLVFSIASGGVNFANSFIVYFAAVLLAFIIHESAHKIVAKRYSLASVYKIWPLGVVLALVLSLVGFVFAAPGSAGIFLRKFGSWKKLYDRFGGQKGVTIREIGIAAAAGPIANIVAAFLLVPVDSLLATKFVFVSAYVALFNLIPIQPLDGARVFTWKSWFWFLLIFIAGILLLSEIMA